MLKELFEMMGGNPWLPDERTHEFATTGEAYDAANSDESIQEGDVLVVKAESVVGLAGAWPIAVTEQTGKFHFIKPGHTLSEYFDKADIDRAIAIAQQLGYPIRETSLA
jgi:hypothetical protein